MNGPAHFYTFHTRFISDQLVTQINLSLAVSSANATMILTLAL